MDEFELVGIVSGTVDDTGYLSIKVFEDHTQMGEVPSLRDFYVEVAYAEAPEATVVTTNQVTIKHELINIPM